MFGDHPFGSEPFASASDEGGPTTVQCSGVARGGFGRALATRLALVHHAAPSRAMARATAIGVTVLACSGTSRAIARTLGVSTIQGGGGTTVQCQGVSHGGIGRLAATGMSLVHHAGPSSGIARATGQSITRVACTGVSRGGFGRAVTGTVILSFQTGPLRGGIARAVGQSTTRVAGEGTSRAIARLAGVSSTVNPNIAASSGVSLGGIPRLIGQAHTIVSCTGVSRASGRTVGSGATVVQSAGVSMAIARLRGEAATRVACAGTSRAVARAVGQSATRVQGGGVSRAIGRLYGFANTIDPSVEQCAGVSRGGIARAIGSSVIAARSNTQANVIRVALGKSTSGSAQTTVPVLCDGADFVFVAIFVGAGAGPVSAVTLDGNPMLFQRQNGPAVDGSDGTFVYKYDSNFPPIAGGVRNVVVTMPVASDRVGVVAIACENVEPNNPVPYYDGERGLTGEPSVVFGTPPDMLVIDAMCFRGGTQQAVAAQPRELANDATIDTSDNGVRFGVSTSTSTTPDTTVAWTGNDDDLGWGHVAIAVQARAAKCEGVVRAIARTVGRGGTRVPGQGTVRGGMPRLIGSDRSSIRHVIIGPARPLERLVLVEDIVPAVVIEALEPPLFYFIPLDPED